MKGSSMNEVWQLVHNERRALVDDISQLSAEQWDSPSLIKEWTIHDVVAHLVDTARCSKLGFIRDMVRAGFDFDRLNENGIKRERGSTPAQTLERLRSVTSRTSSPPAPLDTRLVEEVVHGEDIRRALGISHQYQALAVDRALTLQLKTSVNFGGAKERAAGLELETSDAEVSVGQGAILRGSRLNLLVALSGRSQALVDLEGPGVEILTSRLASEATDKPQQG